MKKLLVFSMVLVAGAISLFAQPKLEIENQGSIDWGKVNANLGKVNYKLHFYNKGNELLRIKSVKPGCGCTTAPISKDSIVPGDEATLDVTLNIGSYSGVVTKSIVVESNDPTTPTSMITLKVDVFKVVSIFPTFLSFNNMYLNKPTEAKTIITNNSKNPIKVTEIVVSPNNMKLSVKPGDVIPPNGNSLEVMAVATPNNIGSFRANIVIKTDSPDMPQIEVGGWGNVIEEINNTNEPIKH